MEEQTKLDSNENMENNVIHLGPPEGYVQQELESNPQKAEETYETQNAGKESLENPVDNIKKSGYAKKINIKSPGGFKGFLVLMFTALLLIASLVFIWPNGNISRLSFYNVYFFIYMGFSVFVFFMCLFLKLNTFSMHKFFTNLIAGNGKYSKLTSPNKKINKICEAYKNSFLVSGDEDYHKTRSNSDLYFGTDTWIQDMNRAPLLTFLKIIPGTFIGLGILGTFIGFSEGLSDIKVSDGDLESIINGVDSLLAGLKNAFNTSIVGVLASVYLNFVVIHPFSNTLNTISKQLCDYLDSKFYVTEVDAMAILDENHNLKPFPVTMEEMMTKLENVSANINHLGNTVGSQVTQSIKSTLDETIEGIIRGEINKLKEELNTVIETLSNCSAQLQAAPQNIKEAAGIMKDSSVTAVEEFKKQNEEAVSTLTQAITDNINSKFESYLETLNKISSVMEKVNEGMGRLPENFLSVTNSIDATSQKIIGNSDALSQAFDKSTQTLSQTTELTSKIVQAYEAQVSVINDSASQIEKVINESNQVTKNSKELLDGYASIDEHIAHIFAEINMSTEKYTNMLSENLTTYFKSFHDATKDISKQFAEATLQLSEEIEKYNSGR